MNEATSDFAGFIAQSKKSAEMAKTQLLRTFEFVPDDKLEWAPSETARTPLQIMAHCGAGNFAFASLIRGEGWQLSMDPVEAGKQIRDSTLPVKSRAEAAVKIEEGCAIALAALDSATPELVGSSIQTAFGPMPMAMFMMLVGDHMSGHARQIDYLQTVWGDMTDHM